eukprot:TRINITY_DN45135_c0_g1_i1.p1 TRINITY_DN45135_c0_g1~~TRINITY_DN45135_c0_g1_i1.p1  ORF type:complete len:439 (+),score=63.90 TRINITY_DN45135_c0_g1_i1:109-1317(+)
MVAVKLHLVSEHSFGLNRSALKSSPLQTAAKSSLEGSQDRPTGMLESTLAMGEHVQVDEQRSRADASKIAQHTLKTGEETDIDHANKSPGRAEVEEIRSFSHVSAGHSRNCGGPKIWHTNLTDWKPKAKVKGKTLTWTELLPVRSFEAMKGPKLGILMLVIDKVFNENVWSEWFAEAKARNLRFRMFIHASRGHWHFNQSMFKEFLVHETIPSSWCKLWLAEMLLLRKSLKDHSVTHLATFSADAVPLKPLSYIYRELQLEPATRMCADMEWKQPWERAETWWLMRRSDAELFLSHAQLIQNEFKIKNGCEEEAMWFYPLLLRSARWGDKARLLNQCVMFTDWKDSCKSWVDHADRLCQCQSLRKSAHTRASRAHPRTYKKIGVEAWKELRRSAFWWGRKFT